MTRILISGRGRQDSRVREGDIRMEQGQRKMSCDFDDKKGVIGKKDG
jgi:hypothetical protein